MLHISNTKETAPFAAVRKLPKWLTDLVIAGVLALVAAVGVDFALHSPHVIKSDVESICNFQMLRAKFETVEMVEPSGFLDDAVLRCMVKPETRPPAFELELLTL